MALKGQLTIRSSASRLMSVIVCLCAFTCLQVPQLSALIWAESVEIECPMEEDGEGSQKEQVVSASARRRLSKRFVHASWPHGNGIRAHRNSSLLRQTNSNGGRPQAIIGHQLANGLRAPLVI